MNDLLGDLGAKYQDASITLEVAWSSHLVERVRQRELDASFALAPFDTAGLHIIDVGSVYRFFVLDPGCPCAEESTIEADALKG